MQSKNNFRSLWRCGIGAVAFALTACAHTPDHSDIPPGTEFTTQILADGTKLFVMKLRPLGFMGNGPMGGGPGGARRSGPESGGGDCFPCEPGQQRGSGNRQGERRPQDLKAIATAMIAENRYCRDGFVMLEQYQQEQSRILRGECRDTANESDRERFAH